MSKVIEQPQKQFYKFQNNKTGEVLAFNWSGPNPPTKEDIAKIKLQRDNVALEQSGGPKVSLPVKIGAGIADILWAPSEAVKPKPLSQEETQKLPLSSRVKRIGQSTLSSVLEPENLAIASLAAMPGGQLAVPTYFAGKMAADEPKLIKEHLENPTLESGAGLVLNTVGLGLGLHGAKVGAESAIPELTTGRRVNETSDVPTIINKQGQPKVQLRLPQGEPPINTNEPIDVPYRMQEELPKGTLQLPEKGEQPIRGQGFTVRAPKNIVPTTERPYEVQAPTTNENISSQLSYGREGSPLVESPTGFQSGKIRTSINETPTVELPTKIQPPKIKLPTPEHDELAVQNAVLDKYDTQGREFTPEEKAIQDEILNKSNIIQNEQPTLKNDWLRNQETEALKVMQKGQSPNTPLGKEIEQVLNERGYETPKSKLNVELPSQSKIDLKQRLKTANEGSLDETQMEYDSQLNRHAINSRTQIPKRSELNETIQLGRDLGKSSDEITQDLMDSGIPEKNIRKVIGEAGFLGIGKKAPIAYRIKEAATKDRPATYEEVKDDSGDIIRAGKAYLLPIPAAIEELGNHTHEAKEISRLVQFVRTEGNRMADKYSNYLHDNNIGRETRTPSEINLDDAEIGTTRVKNSKTGEIITVIREGQAGTNESGLVQYKDGKMEAAPGYELVPRMKGNFWDVIENNDAPANPRIDKAVQAWKNISEQLGIRAEESGAGMRVGDSKLIPFKRMLEGYLPREYSKGFWDSISDNPTAFDSVLEKLMKDKSLSRAEALRYIEMSKKNGEMLSAPQHARLTDYPDYIRDRSVLFNHIDKMSTVLSRAENLGPKDINGPMMSSMIEKIAKSGGDANQITKYLNRALGRETVDPTNPLTQAIKNTMNVITTAEYLPMFAISDMMTAPNIIMRSSVKNWAPALLHNLTMADQIKNAAGTGALHSYLTDELGKQSRLGKYLGMHGAERFLRSWAATTFKDEAPDILEYLLQNKENVNSYGYKTAYKQLKNLTLKNDLQMHQLLDKGKLTNKEIDFAGGRGAEITQGLVDPIDLPYSWSEPNPGIITNSIFKFKRFAYQSTKLMFEAVAENPAKAIPMLLTVFPVTAELIGDTKKALIGAGAGIIAGANPIENAIREIEDRDKKLRDFSPFFKEHPYVSRYLTDLVGSWFLGILGDTIDAANNGKDGLAHFLAGPDFAFISNAWTNGVYPVVDLIKHENNINWDKIEKDFVNFGKSQLPAGMGPAINRATGKSTGPTISVPDRVDRIVKLRR